MTYNAGMCPAQGFDEQSLDTVNIPNSDDLAFFDHLLHTDDPELIKSIILEECRLGVYDTETMLAVLADLGAGFAGVEASERLAAPIPTVSKGKPFSPVEGGAAW